jgi:hypothetical protein
MVSVIYELQDLRPVCLGLIIRRWYINLVAPEEAKLRGAAGFFPTRSGLGYRTIKG